MATFPYAQPIGALTLIVSKLRSSFPEKLDSGVLKKLAIAPNNESYVINTLRFVGLIDKDGIRTKDGHDAFVLSDPDFGNAFGNLIRKAYHELFALHSDTSWTLPKEKLLSFFRTTDKSSGIVGGRQTDTFIKLAELALKREASTNTTPPRSQTSRSESKKGSKIGATSVARKEKPEVQIKVAKSATDGGSLPVALAVKIEINLPTTSDQVVYDAIFSSIRTNLIDRD